MSCARWPLNCLTILDNLLPHVLGLFWSALWIFRSFRLCKRTVLLRRWAYMIAPSLEFRLELFLSWKNNLVPAEFVTPLYSQPIDLVFYCFRHLFHQLISLNLAIRNLAIGVYRFWVKYRGLIVSIMRPVFIRAHQWLAVTIGVVSNRH